MPFYRRRMTYDEMSPYIKKFREYLRQNCSLVAGPDPEAGYLECFYIDKNNPPKNREMWDRYWNNLQNAGYVYCIPFDYDHVYLYILEAADGPKPTVSQTHIRLPKLSYLITLTPEDFFLLMRLIATAKNTPSKDSLSLNFGINGIQSLSETALDSFFLKLRTNYRMNPEYADRKWTAREDISFIANLEPTRDNQLSAMQYLTALQNDDLMYFPAETCVELELDWQEADNNYVVPPQAERRN